MSILSNNIKFLRKQKKWNQTELAELLQVKRGSIASYESKNVEPRLVLILKIAKLFNISLVDLIETDLMGNGGKYMPFRTGEVIGNHTSGEDLEWAKSIDISNIRDYIERSKKIQKMLEGFKIFYKYKMDSYGDDQSEAQKITSDIHNFIVLLEQLYATNEIIIPRNLDSSANPESESSSNNC